MLHAATNLQPSHGATPVVLAVERVQLGTSAADRQDGRERLGQLLAVPAAHARLRRVGVPPGVVRVVADVAAVEPGGGDSRGCKGKGGVRKMLAGRRSPCSHS